MINSYVKQLNNIVLPHYKGELSMLPFFLNDLSSLPLEFRDVVNTMIEHLNSKTGVAYLTIHGKFVKKNKTLRRGLPHIDGNYLPSVTSWGNGGGGGWKVGQNGVTLNSEEHNVSYANPNGGMLIASNYSACKGWIGQFSEDAKEGGDCSHINLGEGFMLASNTLYYSNSQFIHESLPVDKDVFRILYRITLPTNHKFEQ
jgi:hypothetical protein